jgi:2-amino-4-hydroxy-6-hydroxymethyldihydropteridine diphosphokinase
MRPRGQTGGRREGAEESGRGGWIKAAIALGGNLGDSQRILSEATQALAQGVDPGVDEATEIVVLARSHLYKTAPIGPPQPDYLNACILIETTLTPRTLMHRLLKVEHQFGRVRHERWGARSLDLDLLLFGDQIIDLPGLTVPHPRLQERAFVLVPLMEIAPQWPHPIFGKTVAQLLEDLALSSASSGIKKLVQSSLLPLSLWP